MNKLNEREIISIFAKKLDIRDLDDVAAIGRGIIFKSDMLVASTDVPPTMKTWQVARKSIVSCVSDLASKGIKPHAAMISIGLPRNYCTRSHINGLARGFAVASKEFGVKIVGGDTNEADGLVIDCSIIGYANGKIPSRSNARPGDLVIVSGIFGLAPAGLAILMQNAIASGKFKKQAVKSVLEPKPQQHFGLALAKYFSSSIDSSDGLATSLYELAGQSGVDVIVDSVPIAEGLKNFAKENNINPHELVFHGGEEYEIVATIPKSKLGSAELAAKKAGLTIHVIGRVQKKGKDGAVVFANGKILENRGYTHFEREEKGRERKER